MSRFGTLASRLRRYLSERLGRLNVVLSDLGRRVRSTLAARLGDNVAGLVQDAVEVALASPPPEPPRVSYRQEPYSWRDRDDEPQPYRHGGQEDLFGGHLPQREPYPADEDY